MAQSKIRKRTVVGESYALDRIFGGINEAAFYKDYRNRDGAVTWVNSAFAKLMGKPAEELVGKNDFELNPKFAGKYRADDKRVMASGNAVALQETNVADGAESTVQVVKIPVRNREGEVTGVLGMFWPVTERTQTGE